MGLFSGTSNFLFGTDPVNSAPMKSEAEQARAQAEAYRQREQEDYQRQLQFAQYLTQVMSGAAPSVAGLQMQQGMDQVQQTQAGMASGVGGPGQGLAQYGAAQNTADAQTKVAQQTGVNRAAEQDMARQQLGGLYSGVNKMSAGLGQSGDTLGLEYDKNATAVDMANRQAQQQENAALLQGLGGAGAMYFGRRPGA